MKQVNSKIALAQVGTCDRCGCESRQSSWEGVEAGSYNQYVWHTCTSCGYQSGDVPDWEYNGEGFEPPEVDQAAWDAQIAAHLAEEDYFGLAPFLMKNADFLAMAQGLRRAA